MAKSPVSSFRPLVLSGGSSVSRITSILPRRVYPKQIGNYLFRAAVAFTTHVTASCQLQAASAYIHIPGYGWHYAVTVIDYYSRYLLACHLTHSYSALEAAFALKLAREEAERIDGPLRKPPSLVTDNGPSFIARRFVDFVSQAYSHVRIRYRTPTQLGLLDRFHQTLKTEEVYWRLYDHPQHARACLAEFRDRHNRLRPHWALIPEEGGDPVVPEEVYAGGVQIQIPAWQGWAQAAKRKLDELLQEAA